MTDKKLLGKKIGLSHLNMPYQVIKPLPKTVWQSMHPRFDGKTENPRNVENYHSQNVPNGCWNCDNRYCGMVSEFGKSFLSCGLACKNPQKPSYCDKVNYFGICDSWCVKE